MKLILNLTQSQKIQTLYSGYQLAKKVKESVKVKGRLEIRQIQVSLKSKTYARI
jgi:hypothetical protein